VLLLVKNGVNAVVLVGEEGITVSSVPNITSPLIRELSVY